ncbi:MAG: hypothetical protein GTO14_04700 [Anaerolineales bacterium]|nr:hypothetical protein [Anaerolineales bacterium]
MTDQSSEENYPEEDYRSFLLRFWRVEERKPIWRVSLEEPATGEHRGFADLSKLFAFLLEEFCDDGEHQAS